MSKHKHNAKVVPRYGNSLKDKSYLPAIFGGMKITFKHFFTNFKDNKNLKTVYYPEEQPTDITSRYRGVHRLTKREDDTIKCVACFMCATNCPARCIEIKATDRTDGVVDKMPEVFNIDLIECVFCGLCVEACPVDAIRMDTGIFSFTANNRKDFVLDKEKLLSHEKGDFNND
jgi:NADH-quinone oxidoreductase subunit I